MGGTPGNDVVREEDKQAGVQDVCDSASSVEGEDAPSGSVTEVDGAPVLPGRQALATVAAALALFL